MSTISSTWSARREEARRERIDARYMTRMTIGDRRWPRVVMWIALFLVAMFWLVPFVWGIITSFMTEAQAASGDSWLPRPFTIESYTAVLGASGLPTWLLNSTIVAVSVTVVTVLISAMAAYAFSRTTFRGRKALFVATVAAIIVPGQILIVPLFQQMKTFNLLDTLPGVILPQIVAPMMVFILKSFFDSIPQELIDAAKIDGAGTWRVFARIVLPLSTPILLAVSIFVFIGAWNNFLWPFVSTTNPELMTLPVGLGTVKNAYGLNYAQTMASAMIAAAPLLIVFMVFQRRIVHGVATTGLGGQ